jgi:MoxR-like ATPase
MAIEFNYGTVKMNRHEMKVILSYMGIPFKNQGQSSPEVRACLAIERQNNPTQFEKAVDLICRKIIPDSIEVRSETFFHEWAELCDTMFDEKRVDGIQTIDHRTQVGVKNINGHTEAVCQALDSKASDMWATLKDEVNATIEAAKKEFKIIAVQVGNADPVPIEGLVHEKFETILQLAQQRKNIMLVGPSGSGKSFVGPQVAYALGLDYSEQSCSEGMSESMLSGWLLPVGENGTFSYVQSEFVRIYENGGVFLFDEIDAADPNLLVFINSALAGNHFVLPQRSGNPMVKKHKDFVCIAAANTFGNGADAIYHGRNALDGATKDRFRIGMVFFDYSSEVETELVDPSVLEWGRKIRKAINQHKLQRILSTRFLIDATDMIKCQSWNQDDYQESYFLDWAQEDIRLVRGY